MNAILSMMFEVNEIKEKEFAKVGILQIVLKLFLFFSPEDFYFYWLAWTNVLCGKSIAKDGCCHC